MKFEQVPVKNQKFDIGRTINFTRLIVSINNATTIKMEVSISWSVADR